ncbi:hypothetical protein MAPG_06212 [Magnaporthiopsis poae ATCC 64411]|uniref:Uncharacterized protein n=1 Tax=Magnaporthiopsis poae (strain ATCC 64411 / 73-15) TaxID=644358 RepID=A0A0C4E1F2_MAGP6|nr:hypothetical protein MAPG_06212 [Magnaporthiopsis poae ATCC 64411]
MFSSTMFPSTSPIYSAQSSHSGSPGQDTNAASSQIFSPDGQAEDTGEPQKVQVAQSAQRNAPRIIVTPPPSSPTSSTSSSSFHSARSSRSVSPDRFTPGYLAEVDTEDPAEPQVQVTQQNVQQQQRKPFRDTQLERMANTTATLGNATIEAFALSESLSRFLAGDERLVTRTSPVYHRQRPGCVGKEESSRADLTLDEMLHLHVHVPLDRLSRQAWDLKEEVLLLSYQDEAQAKAVDRIEQQQQRQYEEEIQHKILALAKAASALSNLVVTKLQPWKRVCEKNPKMDYPHKMALVDFFASKIDAWLRDQCASTDR